MTSVVGAIFPISTKHAARIFDEGRTAFAKYTKFSKLEKNCKIIFYISKEKKLIGEGTIESIEKLVPKTAWARFEHQIFLDETEFEQYSTKSPVGGKSRTMPEVTVYLLRDLKKYCNKTTNGMTPAGRYVTKEEYEKIANC